MIENLFTSKTRIKLLKVFLSNPDKRYYLRGLEKELQESLTPLRRELLRLTNLGILSIQEEANIKYYSLNKNFERVEELQKLVLGPEGRRELSLRGTLIEAKGTEAISKERLLRSFWARNDRGSGARNDSYQTNSLGVVVTVLLIGLVAFLIYVNSKNIQNLAKAFSSKGSVSLFEARPRSTDEGVLGSENRGMRSGRWKIMPGSWPVLGGTEEGEEKSKEL